MHIRILLLFSALIFVISGHAQSALHQKIDQQADLIENKVVDWRHNIHQNPELSNREFQTAEKVARHLKSLGIKVKTGVAHTGVVGYLETGKPGPVIALRADMDALPVTERVDIPWASQAKGEYLGEEVGVMHACGHDTHVAMLMGAAEILAGMKNELSGTIVFLFQPAEEGAPPGEEGGAKMMVAEGVLENPKVDVAFGLHINSQTPVGHIAYKPGGALAAADIFNIKVLGKQSHGSQPWGGIDPITIGAQIVQGLNNIVARQTELTKEAAVISVGKFDAGVRNNIIPESAQLTGTIRTLDTDMQDKIHEKIKLTAESIAMSAGGKAEVEIIRGVPVTYNNPELTAQMIGTIEQAAGKENVHLVNAVTGAEDFAFYANEVPSLFLFLGGMPPNAENPAPHHTPDFYVDDAGMKLGVRTLCYLTIDYMNK
ncbi:MAG TPA: amidohydrolase [Saprospiraceae bacterium]|nr:amidohydrolase [Saprospiraceae bacterium]